MFKTPWIALAAPLLLSSLACGDSDGRTSAYGSGVTLGSDEFGSNDGVDSNDGNDGIGTSGGDDSDPTDSGGIKLDTLGGDEDGRTSAGNEGGGAQGCQAIDFLFVIDNSGSMGNKQANLLASFQPFMTKIQQTVVDVDSYHIMVVKTDEFWSGCDPIQCGFFPQLCQFGDINACTQSAPSVCDDTLGAGVNYPIGTGASNQYCELVGGQRYITPAEPFLALPGRFSCIANVGTSGSGAERQAESLIAALQPAINGPGGCNSGFLRDDAVLVVTLITDEEDSYSPGTANSWYEAVLARKGGDPTSIVMLGLINDTDAAVPICPAGSDDPVKLREFIQKFPNTISGSVCADNYASFFEQAVDLIDTTCDMFEPIG